jgi:hypothetical protein
MSSLKEKREAALPAMKLDILQRHNSILIILRDLVNETKHRIGNEITLNPKLWDILVSSIQTNKGLLIVTGTLTNQDLPPGYTVTRYKPNQAVSWNEITDRLYSLVKDEFRLVSGWLFKNCLIEVNTLCRGFLDIVEKTDHSMGIQASVKGTCMIRDKTGEKWNVIQYREMTLSDLDKLNIQ